jgi:hypothetical protein
LAGGQHPHPGLPAFMQSETTANRSRLALLFLLLVKIAKKFPLIILVAYITYYL